METVSIRDLRGASLREMARAGKPLAITNHRVLIGVLVPVATAWVEHLIDTGWSQVRQSIAEGEQAAASGAPMAALDHLSRSRAADVGEDPATAVPDRLVAPLLAAVTGGTVTQAPRTREVLQQLRAVLNPQLAASGQAAGAAEDPVRTARIGDLSASLIEKAGQAGQTLAITHDRELIGIIIPVTQGLVQFLIEQNMSRVLYNMTLGEKQLGTADQLTTLDRPIRPTGTAAACE